MRKLIPTILAMAMVISLFAAFPATAGASISTQPSSKSVTAGDFTTLTVEGSGLAAAIWYISKDNGATFNIIGAADSTYIDISSVSTATLKLYNVPMEYSGHQFRAMVIFTMGTSTFSNIATLTVKEPEKRSCPTGGSAEFDCTAEAERVVADNKAIKYTITGYQWQMLQGSGMSWSWNNIADGAYYAGTKTAKLTVKDAPKTLDGRMYRCLFSATIDVGYGAVATNGPSSRFMLNVTDAKALKITTDTKDATTVEGRDPNFSIKVDGEDLVYQWYVSTDGGSVWQKVDTNSFHYRSQNTNLANYLYIRNTPLSFNGYMYKCEVTSDGDTVTSKASKLTVTAADGPPVLNTGGSPAPASTTIPAGANASFWANFSINPICPVSYEWYVSTNNGVSWDKVTANSVYSDVDAAILKLENVPISYNGNMYRCIAANSKGELASPSAKLTVVESTGATMVTKQPVDCIAAVGGTATFTMETSGGPEVSWTWTVSPTDSEIVDVQFGIGDREGKSIIEHAMFDGKAIVTGTNGNTLTISNVPKELDGWLFFCRIFGFDASGEEAMFFSSAAKLTVIDDGEAPTITGPASLTLKEGYGDTYSDAFTLKGAPEPKMTIVSGDPKITFYEDAMKLRIAEGLEPGTYVVKLEASNGLAPDAEHTFTLTVTTDSSGSMSNFSKARAYVRGQFPDVDETQWYGYDDQKTIALAYEYDLMKGNADGTFNPGGNVTVGQALAVACRVHVIYSGGTTLVEGSTWYQVYVDYAIENGMIKATDFSDYGRPATRAEMVYIFASAVPAEELPAVNTVNSLPDVDNGTPYSKQIFMMYEAGGLTGNDDAGTFTPNANISRAQAAAIIARVILPAERRSGKTYG